jgi:hypothetical protein
MGFAIVCDAVQSPSGGAKLDALDVDELIELMR